MIQKTSAHDTFIANYLSVGVYNFRGEKSKLKLTNF